ncbi:hypothetical protein GYMLUDRAFT_56598 [Collybiopsis luxurians FD-317 M1]|nr:hypothetical protein GYMLUDRAFT_56598 [Collybiopsis luxurians FD-317 M1]
MAKSPSKRKTSTKSPNKRTRVPSPRKAGTRSPSKRVDKLKSNPLRTIRTVSTKQYRALVNAGISVAPGATYAHLEKLAQNLEAERADSCHHESPAVGFSGDDPASENASQNTTVRPLNLSSSFYTPLRPSHGGSTGLFNPSTLFSPSILNDQIPSHSEPVALDPFLTGSIDVRPDPTGLSPLPPSSPLRDTQSQPDLSSPLAQTSPVSSPTITLPSSPTKPRRNRATQKDPLFGRVRGASKGSQPWIRDRAIPRPRNKVSESTRRYRLMDTSV